MADETQTDTKVADTKVADTKVETKTETKVTDTKTDTKADTKVKADDWRTIPDDWEDAEELRKIGPRFNSGAEVIRSYARAEKQVSKAIIPLGKNATAEEVAKYRRTLNIPEAPTGYHDAVKIDVPAGIDLESDGAKKMIDGYYAAAHAANMTPAQVKGVMAPFFNMVAEDAKARTARIEELATAADDKLKKEWRSEYDVNNRIGQNFVTMVAKDHPEFAYMMENAIIDGMKAGDHPVWRKVAATLGRRMGEAQLATLTLSDKDVDEGKKTMEDLTAKIHEASRANNRKEVERLSAERRSLSQKLYGPAERRP